MSNLWWDFYNAQESLQEKERFSRERSLQGKIAAVYAKLLVGMESVGAALVVVAAVAFVKFAV